jgi:mannosyltransferase
MNDVTQAQQTPRQRTHEPVPDGTPAPTGSAVRRLATVPTWLPATLPAVLMLVVGRYKLRNPTLGWDENATWIASQRTPGQIADLARHFDGVISPYYLFMHFWTAVFGDSEFWMRAPSLIAVAAGVGIAADLGRRLFSPSVGLLGGLLLVLVPQLSRYAQDARAYGLAFLFATLSTLLLYRALQRPSWLRWIAYAAVLTLVGWAHILGLLVLVGHAYTVGTRWWADRDRALTRWMVVTPIAVVPVLPFIYLGLTQRGGQLDWIPAMSWSQVWAAPGNIFGSAAAGLLLIGLAFAVRWPDGRVVRELTALAVLPPALLIAVSFVTSSLWVPRYVLFVVPAVCLLAAAALGGLKMGGLKAGGLKAGGLKAGGLKAGGLNLRAVNLRAVTALVLLAAVAIPAQEDLRKPVSHMGADFRTVAGIIARDQQPGDVVVYGASGTWSLRAGVDYQLRGRAKPRDVLLSRPAAEVGQLGAVQCADQVACLGTSQRVWFFRQWQTGAPLSNAGPLTATLREKYRQARVWHATKATLVLFERR